MESAVVKPFMLLHAVRKALAEFVPPPGLHFETDRTWRKHADDWRGSDPDRVYVMVDLIHEGMMNAYHPEDSFDAPWSGVELEVGRWWSTDGLTGRALVERVKAALFMAVVEEAVHEVAEWTKDSRTGKPLFDPHGGGSQSFGVKLPELGLSA